MKTYKITLIGKRSYKTYCKQLSDVEFETISEIANCANEVAGKDCIIIQEWRSIKTDSGMLFPYMAVKYSTDEERATWSDADKCMADEIMGKYDY